MGKFDSRQGRSNGLAAYVAGFTVPACVYKNCSLCAADGFRNFGQKLLQPHDLYFRWCQSAAQFLGDNPARAVVACVADCRTRHEHPWHLGRRIQPRVTWSALPSPPNLVQ
jgi:hypothetical protein